MGKHQRSTHRAQGTVDTWQDDRGFGFITPDRGGPRVFVHIKAFVDRSRRPRAGDAVTYLVRRTADGRLQAGRVGYADRSFRSVATPARMAALLLAGAALAGVAVAVILGRLPVAVGWVFHVASVVTFLAYALDKSAARRGRSRIPESTLHTFALLGGWPGALVAQQWLRHKSKKQSFRVRFWATVVLNCVVLAGICFVTTG